MSLSLTGTNFTIFPNLSRGKDGDYYEQYNYAIGESTEPGSTFKLASVIAALEEGLVNTLNKLKNKEDLA